MTRNPMRRTGPYPIALSAANAWFDRLSERLGTCAMIHGSVSQARHGQRLRQT
jgi:hypothetical protein